MPLNVQLDERLYAEPDLPPIPLSDRKVRGAYYTPGSVAEALCRWTIADSDDFLLDPACGDGRFITQHENSVGVDQNLEAVCQASERAPHALVIHADFFAWAAETDYRFDCVVGNPPFIRYQRFRDEARRRALALCVKKGAEFSGLASAWAPFLVVAAGLLKRGGKAAFVVPAEIGHAPYAAPVLEYFVRNFATVHVIAIRSKLFPELSEDCWLLRAQDFGGQASGIHFSALESFLPTAEPPSSSLWISLAEWRETWKRRLRPLLMPKDTRLLYQSASVSKYTRRFRDIASVGIGYVSGGNDFFHLSRSKAANLEIPECLLQPTVRNSRYLCGDAVSADLVERWWVADEPMLLLHIPKELEYLPMQVQRYLDSENGERTRSGYKCRHREPWYSVPDVHFPEFFMSYFSGRQVNLVTNEARVTCTNALHYVRLKEPGWASYVCQAWKHPFSQLSCEVEGHPLGG